MIDSSIMNRMPDTTIQNNVFQHFNRPTEFQRGANMMNKEVVTKSILRLEFFLSYLSDKIKSNTLKISTADAPAAPFAAMQSGEGLSQTTASRSDLSIDEINLRRFKDYMLLSDRQKPNQESLYNDRDIQAESGNRIQNLKFPRGSIHHDR